MEVAQCWYVVNVGGLWITGGRVELETIFVLLTGSGGHR